jgi:hypothetical protein
MYATKLYWSKYLLKRAVNGFDDDGGNKNRILLAFAVCESKNCYFYVTF